MARTDDRPSSSETSGGHGPCPVGFCPVGMFLSISGQARPEAVEHLVAAGREFMLALQAVVSSRVDDLERSSPLEKIEVE